MSDETIPPVEEVLPGTSAGENENPPVGEENPSGGEENPGKPAPAPALAPVPKTDWKDRQLAKKNQRIAELQAELEKHRAAPGEPAAGATPPTGTSPDEIEKRAAQLVAAREYDSKIEKTLAVGKSEWEDFQTKILDMHKVLVSPGDSKAQESYNRVVGAILDLESPHEILYSLAKDPEKAERLLELSPVKLGMELGKLTQRVEGDDPALLAPPKPITPVAKARASAGDMINPSDPSRADKLSTQEWMARRSAEIEEKRKSSWAGRKGR
jgi:hypothetical protein